MAPRAHKVCPEAFRRTFILTLLPRSDCSTRIPRTLCQAPNKPLVVQDTVQLRLTPPYSSQHVWNWRVLPHRMPPHLLLPFVSFQSTRHLLIDPLHLHPLLYTKTRIHKSHPPLHEGALVLKRIHPYYIDYL